MIASPKPKSVENNPPPGTIPFITTWKTDNPGISANNQITIPTNGGATYNYTVDWGDPLAPGTTTHTGNATHTYTNPGTYTVTITGLFPQILFRNGGDKEKILTVEQWGNNQWISMESAFYGCSNLQGNFTDAPDLSTVVSFINIFRDCTVFNGSIGNWDVSNVQWMPFAFSGCEAFNQDINSWVVDNVTQMQSTFQGATAFNQPLDNWDVSNVIIMSSLFQGATSFNQNINNWKVNNVRDMPAIFSGATNFNQPLDQWNISSLTNLNFMFAASGFNQDISAWDTSNITHMVLTFADSNFDKDIGNWNVENLTTAFNMFQNVTLSTNNYDALLIGWNAQNLKPSVNLNGGNSQYCAGESARDNMLTSDNWTITDGGKASPTVDDLIDQNLPNSFTLPVITGTQLTGAEGYYTGTNGTGTFFKAGDVINYADFAIYPVRLYIYDGSGACSSQEDFALTLTTVALPFITTWKTDNPGVSNNNQVTIFTYGLSTYNYNIDWGDMNTDNNVTGNITHTYLTPGTYTITITGTFPRINFGNGGDRRKLMTIEQWGNTAWESMREAFLGCENLQGNFTDVPNLSNVTSTHYMFRDAKSFNHPINNWDVSAVTDMFGMFAGATQFNQPLNSWNMSNVTNIGAMFSRTDNFNQNLNAWDVGNVTSMLFTFDTAIAFNQDITNWNTSSVIAMGEMFENAIAFNQDISQWNTSNVVSMEEMFKGATTFNQNIGGWNVGNVSNMSGMFDSATSFDQNLENWDVTALNNASDMFQNVTLSTANYDALLIGWNSQNLNSNVTFSGGNSQYCIGEAARENMLSINQWSITDGGYAGITADTLTDVIVCSSYVLPVLNVNNNYYTETNGGGTMLNAGDSITTSQTIHIFTTTGTAPNICSDESAFNVTITGSIQADNLGDVEACQSYTLPTLNTGNRYYTETNGGGILLTAGDIISSSQTIFVYAGTSGCASENSFIVTIDTTTPVDTLENVTECEVYTLPVLENGNYFTESGGNGTELFADDTISTSQEIFVFFESGTCSNESSFTVTIDPSLCDQEIFDICEFPKFFTPNGDGINDLFELVNTGCSLNGELRIFDRFGRLVFQTSNLNRSWDGTFSGQPLPASDYWYQFIDGESGNLTSSHFSLKR